MDSEKVIKRDSEYVLHTYNRNPIVLEKGHGLYAEGPEGQKYLDLTSGIGVNSLGYCDVDWAEAVAEQAHKLQHTSNLYYTAPCGKLAKKLCKRTGMSKVFFGNSGAEANENALKLASFHTGLKRILAASKAFHGRTSLAVEATDNPKLVAPVNANGHVQFLPLNDLEAFQSELAKGDVAAVIVECIQGVGGIRLATSEFMQGLRKACSENGTVLICDEIQCGYGRSGKFFAHQHTGVRPDIITCAKGIGNGFPMGAVLISPQFKAVFGQLGTTFGGNHLACTAALAVLDVIEEEHLVENAASVGSYLLAQLKTLAAETPSIVDVRGEGLMIGIEFSDSIKTLRTRLVKEQHVFTGAASTNILRLLPPLSLTKAEADDFLSRLKQVL
mgnify:CR=1 FL=1